MGRKWTNVKFVLDDRNETVVEASSNPRTKEEALFDFLRDRWDDENVAVHENVDVMFGGPSVEKIGRWMDEVFEACPFVEQAGVVCVSDSAHAGSGYVFERDGDRAQKIDEYQGYEGAEGNDVAGMIGDDYYIRVSPEWLWD